MLQDIQFKSAQHVIDEVRNMNVKGGSPFGRAAAWAYSLACTQERFAGRADLTARFDDISSQLLALKPTMATIYNTKSLVYKKLDSFPEETALDIITCEIDALCQRIIHYSLDSVNRLGENGANLIRDGASVLMHSYSSALMSVFTAAARQGRKFSLTCTESRPLRESRVAAKILQELHVPVTYITYASEWELMPACDLIIMGADTIAWDGSVANKMGTALISQLAQCCRKPVYIASELYKLDRRTAQGHPIVLERRVPDEIVSPGDFDSMDGIEVVNQFFDLTPANQITGLITERGVIAPATVSLNWDQLEAQLLNG